MLMGSLLSSDLAGQQGMLNTVASLSIYNNMEVFLFPSNYQKGIHIWAWRTKRNIQALTL